MATSQSITNQKNYQVAISQNGNSNGSVIANANAKLKIMIENKWVNVMEALGLSTDGGGLVGTAVAAASILSGSNYTPLIATSHVWRGSSGIELSLDLRFDAWSDPVADVVMPVEKLLTMFVPTRTGGVLPSALSSFAGLLSVAGNTQGDFLAPPGPTPYSYRNSGASANGLITVLLGQVMQITQLIPTTISWEFEDRFTTSGAPVCALVQANFISYVVPSLTDILGYFLQGSLGATATPNAGVNSNAQTPGTSGSNTPGSNFSVTPGAGNPAPGAQIIYGPN